LADSEGTGYEAVPSLVTAGALEALAALIVVELAGVALLLANRRRRSGSRWRWWRTSSGWWLNWLTLAERASIEAITLVTAGALEALAALVVPELTVITLLLANWCSRSSSRRWWWWRTSSGWWLNWLTLAERASIEAITLVTAGALEALAALVVPKLTVVTLLLADGRRRGGSSWWRWRSGGGRWLNWLASAKGASDEAITALVAARALETLTTLVVVQLTPVTLLHADGCGWSRGSRWWRWSGGSRWLNWLADSESAGNEAITSLEEALGTLETLAALVVVQLTPAALLLADGCSRSRGGWWWWRNGSGNDRLASSKGASEDVTLLAPSALEALATLVVVKLTLGILVEADSCGSSSGRWSGC
jgi:hypothetical protein